MVMLAQRLNHMPQRMIFLLLRYAKYMTLLLEIVDRPAPEQGLVGGNIVKPVTRGLSFTTLFPLLGMIIN